MGDSHQAAFRILSDFRKGKCAHGHCLESAEKRQEQKSDIVDIDLDFEREILILTVNPFGGNQIAQLRIFGKDKNWSCLEKENILPSM
ncbi:hypothetical protein NC653_005554 [Populus alba x Populus x berolinensis]|uniref:Uncharacterized protein n=1 Tax=Populus alba x Populus x berolinensis TaxID=444605 RepID=A0AAD6WBI5_9ROSI|nr:hypothetical protein NC653_005554 [Populus alba x Populus x berolinensis]